jgi:hypothetical protein
MGRNFGRLTAIFGLALAVWTASSDVLFSYIKYEARDCMYGKLCGGFTDSNRKA